MNTYKRPQPIKDSDGNTVYCSHGCHRVARHLHHHNYRCNGGSDHPRNLVALCQKCHVALHSQRGDFKRWGSLGGSITASKGTSIPNLKQFQGEAGRVRWEQYCQRRANMQMGVAA